MKTDALKHVYIPCQGIKSIALIGAIAALLGVPVAAWSNPTLLYDSTVSTPFVAGVKHSDDPSLSLSGVSTGFLQFTLSNALPIGVIGTDVDKATLKVFITKVKTDGELTIRGVTQDWLEALIPDNGIAPLLDAVTPAKSFKITSEHAGHWVELDVTELVKGWIDTPSSNYGLALTVENRNPLEALIDSKEKHRYQPSGAIGCGVE